MIKLWLRLLAVILWFGADTAWASQNIDSVRMNRSEERTRVVFDLQGPAEHKIDKLSNPDRLVVDISAAQLGFDINQLDFSNTPVKAVRTGQHGSDLLRVVFDLAQPIRASSQLLMPDPPSGWRLLVDLIPAGDAGTGTPPAKAAAVPSMIKQTPASGRKMVVALDPGHGGQDPGAIGPSGTREKDVVLQIARRIAALIDREPGMRAVLIRTGDYYVPLADRRGIAAERHRADVFLSIHADAFTDSRAHGASVFALSNRGATSARASYLAKMANDSDRVAGVYQEERENSALLSVLADMTTTGSMTHSLVLGRMILEEMGQVTKLHGDRRQVEQAGFAVLREPSMVSLLVETGFISNRQEERNLRDAGHQEKVARAVVGGLRSYFESHPQPETWYAQNRRNSPSRPSTHEISRGETLSAIARRYSVSEAALRSHNGLRGDTIRIGQVLKIPPG